MAFSARFALLCVVPLLLTYVGAQDDQEIPPPPPPKKFRNSIPIKVPRSVAADTGDDSAAGWHSLKSKNKPLPTYVGKATKGVPVAPPPSPGAKIVERPYKRCQPEDADCKPLYMAIFSGGGFMKLREKFIKVPGVVSTNLGYTGGFTKDPTYEQVCQGATGHTEAVQVFYDKSVHYSQLAKYFFTTHNAFTRDLQGGLMGFQFRSAVFVVSKEQANIFVEVRHDLEDKVQKNFVTDMVTFDGTFYTETRSAEELQAVRVASEQKVKAAMKKFGIEPEPPKAIPGKAVDAPIEDETAPENRKKEFDMLMSVEKRGQSVPAKTGKTAVSTVTSPEPRAVDDATANANAVQDAGVIRPGRDQEEPAGGEAVLAEPKPTPAKVFSSDEEDAPVPKKSRGARKPNGLKASYVGGAKKPAAPNDKVRWGSTKTKTKPKWFDDAAN